MSFQKARDLLRLACLSASRHRGITIREIAAEFGVGERTAQRMIQALKEVFPALTHHTDSDRRRWWRLRDTSLIGMQGVCDPELVALEMSIRRADRDGAHGEAEALRALSARLLALLPAPNARRAEVDAEAVLEARGYACRPGPRVKTPPAIMNTIAAALKGPFRLVLWYQGAQDATPRQRVTEPYGLLLGTRPYLIARATAGDARMRRFRLDRIAQADLTGDWFEKDRSFDLGAYAARSFGSFHAEEEFTRVTWRFTPAAAPTARAFEFHPLQELIDQPDGGLIVTFEASGLVEMAWHLYQWGEQVEVLEPATLQDLVANHRNTAITALP